MIPEFSFLQAKNQYDDFYAFHPCFSITIYLDSIHEDDILDFFDQSMNLLHDKLLWCDITGSGKRKRTTKTAYQKVRSWKGSMTKTYADLNIWFYDCQEGAGANSLTLYISQPDYLSTCSMERKQGLTLLNSYIDPVIHGSGFLRLTFDSHHPLLQNNAILDWLMQLQIVRQGRFLSGVSGFALNLYGESSTVIRKKVLVVLRKYSGIDLEFGLGLMRLLRYDKSTGSFTHFIKRANWLTFLSGNCRNRLENKNIELLKNNDEIVLHPLEGHALCIQSGSKPVWICKSDSAYHVTSICTQSIRIAEVELYTCLQPWLEGI